MTHENEYSYGPITQVQPEWSKSWMEEEKHTAGKLFNCENQRSSPKDPGPFMISEFVWKRYFPKSKWDQSCTRSSVALTINAFSLAIYR